MELCWSSWEKTKQNNFFVSYSLSYPGVLRWFSSERHQYHWSSFWAAVQTVPTQSSKNHGIYGEVTLSNYSLHKRLDPISSSKKQQQKNYCDTVVTRFKLSDNCRKCTKKKKLFWQDWSILYHSQMPLSLIMRRPNCFVSPSHHIDPYRFFSVLRSNLWCWCSCMHKRNCSSLSILILKRTPPCYLQKPLCWSIEIYSRGV